MLRRLAELAGSQVCKHCSAGSAPLQRSFQQSAHLCRSFQESVTEKIESEFDRDAKAAALAVAALGEKHRSRVLEALLGTTEAPGTPRYLHQLLRDADKNRDGVLDTSELETALKQHTLANIDTRVDRPSREELIRVFTASTIPFIGFGFLDNLIMILAGDYIDFYIGSALALSTMAAAGLGNMISDVAGIFCADMVEDRARIFKFGRFPHLSPVQKRLPSVVWIKSSGAIIGIVTGCLLGMFPLLFSKHKEGEHLHEPAASASA